MESALAGTLRGQQRQKEDEIGLRRTLSDLIFYTDSSSNAPPPVQKNAIPAICLESPDDPICDKLHQIYYLPEYLTQSQESPRRDTRPATAPTGIPTVHYVATNSPTRDLCYGNMAKFQHGKFCHSEMPSVSMEPSDQPTQFEDGPDEDSSSSAPSGSQAPTTIIPATRIPSVAPTSHVPTFTPSERPSASPSAPAPTIRPSERPSASPSMDVDDDIVHFDDPESEDVDDTDAPSVGPSISAAPTNAPTTHAPTLPEGEQFSYDEDGDGRESVVNYAGPYRPNSSAFRLKLYWETGYYWQEEMFERKWCMRCSDNQECGVGEHLFLGDCGNWHRSAYFDFVYFGNNVVQIELILSSSGQDQHKLCLERNTGDDRQVTLHNCNVGNINQHWKASLGSFTGDRFEISQTLFGGVEYCLTNHHHPKYGERLELFTCEETRRDTTNFWNVY